MTVYLVVLLSLSSSSGVIATSTFSSFRSIRGATTTVTTSSSSTNAPSTGTHVALDASQLPLRILKEEIEAAPIDDVYHCDDPEEVEDEFDKDKTVRCDWDTYEWELDALDEDEIPRHCDDWDWEFDGGDVDNLRDWEEPCYLWSILYGDLTAVPSNLPSVAPSFHPSDLPTASKFDDAATTTSTDATSTTSTFKFPTDAPTTLTPSLAPTEFPSLDPTTLEPTASPTTLEPTTVPTAEPTPEPTAEETLEQSREYPLETLHDPDNLEENNVDSPTIPTTAPTDTPTLDTTTPAPTKPQIQIQFYEISTIVMTYLMNPVSRRRRRPANSLTMDRDVLELVTAKHVQREMKRSLAFWLEQQELTSTTTTPLAVSVDLTLTSVRAFLLPNETMVVTEALSGQVRVEGPPVDWPTSMEPQVEAAFHGTALRRYVKELQLSPDAVLQRTAYIEVGLPLDLLGGVPNPDSNPAALNEGDNDTTVWTVGGVEFSLTTLAIIAGSIAIFSILLLLCVCWKLRAIRKQNLAAADEQQSMPTTTKPSHSTEESETTTHNNHNKTPSKKKSKRSLRSAKTAKTKNKRRTRGNNNDDDDRSISPSASSEMIDESDPSNNRYYQRYVAETDDRSLATSTYSYLDSNLHRDAGGISLAPSFLYGNDDASLQSKTMWSLIDGITNQDEDASYNYHQTASPSAAMRPRDDNADLTTTTTPNQLISPRNMMITTASKAPYDDSTAGGEDDNLSLTSLGVGMSYQDRITLAKTGAGVTPAAASSKPEEQAPAAKTPTGQDNTPTNPFAGDDENEVVKTAGRLGVSARKKKTSYGSGRFSNGSAGSSGSVRKALSQLAACGSSSNDRAAEDQQDLLPAPSDEDTPAAAVAKEKSQRGSTGSRSRKAGDNSKEVNQRLSNLGDSSLNSKNSSLLPDKLFQDDTLDSSKASANNGNLPIKDADGNYVIDTMSSF